MKLKEGILLGIGSCCALCERGFLLVETRTCKFIGVYRFSWDVPTSQRSSCLDRAIQKLENPIPTFV